MRSPRLKAASLILVGMAVVPVLAFIDRFLTAPAGMFGSPSASPAKRDESGQPSNQEGRSVTVNAEVTRSNPVERPKPQSLHFKGVHDHGKVCLPYRGDPNSLAMYELTSFRVIRLIRGTETLEERIAKRPLTFKGIGRPKGGPRLAVGRTYTVRLVPSDETWKQIERGEEVVSLDCQEIEIVPDED